MILQAKINTTSFQADNRTVQENTGKYKDPLMNWPLRGMAFTNEVGEAMRPIIGKYANITWAPALMYMGADIYDKYKNNETQYSPDSIRCLKQAIFQGMASVFMPLVAVKAGQNIFSLFGKFTNDKISLNTRERISDLAEEFIANGQMKAFQGKEEDCIKGFSSRVFNNLRYKNALKARKNPIRRFYFNLTKKLGFKQNNRILEYARKTIRELISLHKNVLNPSDDFKKSKYYKIFTEAIKDGQTENVAVKSVLSRFQKNSMMRSKLIKTLGGFAALGLTIKPIDILIEDILIGKVVTPGIDKIEHLQHMTSKEIYAKLFN